MIVLGHNDNIERKISASRECFFLKRHLLELDYNDNMKIKISGSQGYFFLKRNLVIHTILS
jgi:hypothetical protein